MNKATDVIKTEEIKITIAINEALTRIKKETGLEVSAVTTWIPTNYWLVESETKSVSVSLSLKAPELGV